MLATIVVGVIMWIISIIACWGLFTKAGEPGWKAIIPIYSTYVMFKLSWKVSMFWVWFVLLFASGFLSGFDNLVAAIISVVLSIAAAILGIVFYVKLAKAYGKGGGFAVGLIFLNPIFLLILGLGKSEYVGVQD